jgi:hypothetical protein
MPLYYNNADEPYFSQTYRTWPSPQDWTLNGMDTLELYFRGDSDNGPERLYLFIEDDAGRVATVIHPDPEAILTMQWQQWSIPLADLITEDVDVTAIRKISIRAGDIDNLQPSGIGIIYVDNIRVIHSKSDEN